MGKLGCVGVVEQRWGTVMVGEVWELVCVGVGRVGYIDTGNVLCVVWAVDRILLRRFSTNVTRYE